MPPTDFTTDQADDLARHFLGQNWEAFSCASTRIPGTARVLRDLKRPSTLYSASSWLDAFESAGAELPPYRNAATIYASTGATVTLGDRHICTAVSNTMAKRIASALNKHTPNRRGI